MKRNVLITGASGGIGKEFAIAFAKEGDNLILTGRDERQLKSVADKLREKYSIDVWCIKMDLSQKEVEEKLLEWCKNREIAIDILVNNAGYGYVGKFLEENLQQLEDMAKVNMIALSKLCWLCANEMKKRKKGIIINIASTGAYHPGPYTALYYATKAFVLSLSQALEIELKSEGIRVLTVCPGAVNTGFSKKAGRRDNVFAMSPPTVANKVVKELNGKKNLLVPGLFYKFFVHIPRRIGRCLVCWQQKNMAYHIDK